MGQEMGDGKRRREFFRLFFLSLSFPQRKSSDASPSGYLNGTGQGCSPWWSAGFVTLSYLQATRSRAWSDLHNEPRLSLVARDLAGLDAFSSWAVLAAGY